MREKRSTANSIPSGDDEEVVEVARARLGAGVTYRTASLSAVLCFGYFAARYFVGGVSGHVADFLLVLLGVAIAGGLVPGLGSRIVSRALGLLDLGSCLAASGRRRFACAIAGPTIGLAFAGAIGFIALTTGSVLGGAVSVGCILIQIAAVIPMNLGILGPGPRGPGLPLFRLGIFGRDPRAECLPSTIIATSATVMAVGLIAQAIRFESAGFLAPGSIATAAMAIIGSVVAWVSGVGAIRLFRNGSKVRELRENTFRWQAPDPGLSVDLGLILAAIESIRRPRSPADRAAALVDAFGRIVARPIGWKERIAFSIAHAVMIMAAVAMVAAAVVGWKARFVGPWFIERSPDGRRVVMVERGGATIWDTVRGEEVAVLFRSGDPVLDAAFSPDGTRVVIASKSGGSIWDAEAGTRSVTLQGDPAAEGREYHVLAVAFSPDGNRIVGRIDLFTVRVWDAGSGAIVEGPVDPDLATLP